MGFAHQQILVHKLTHLQPFTEIGSPLGYKAETPKECVPVSVF